MSNLKETFALKFDELTAPGAQAFAAFLRGGSGDGTNACWGALAERFAAEFATDDDRVAAWPKLTEVGDPRALLLFLYLSRDRPTVLTAVAADAPSLPRSVQRALVTIEDAEPLLTPQADALHPAARELREGNPKRLVRHRRLIRGRLNKLLAQRFTAPDAPQPGEEVSP